MEALPDYRQSERTLTGLPVDVLEAALAMELQKQLVPMLVLTPERMAVAKSLQLIARRRGPDIVLESVDIYTEPVSDQFPVVQGTDLGAGT